MADLIQIRRDTRANWASANPKLAIGEVGIITDNNTPGNTGSLSFKVGNGTNLWNQMPEQVLIGPDTLENISASIAAVQTGSAADLVEVSQSLNNRITSVSSSLESHIGNVDTRLTTVSGSIDTRINNVSSSLDTKINNVSSSLGTTISSSSAQLNSKIDNASASIVKTMEDEYALQDGYYGQMSVGLAENLISPDGVTDNAPYVFRTSAGDTSIGTGYATLQKMEGHTVKFNQVINPPTQTVAISGLAGEITLTINNDGSITANGTTTANRYFRIVFGQKNKAVCIGTGTTDSRINYTDGYSRSNAGKKRVLYSDFKANDVYIYFAANETYTNLTFYPQCNVLTDIFGTNTEIATTLGITEAQIDTDTGADAFEAWLTKNVGYKDYYPYTDGKLVSVNVDGLKTVGFNQWDEEWERGSFNLTTGEKNDGYTNNFRSKNPIAVIDGSSYYMKVPYGSAVLSYDNNGYYLGCSQIASGGGAFTPKTGAAYILFTAGAQGADYKNDICINLSWSGYRNGEYEPYWTETLDLSWIKSLKDTNDNQLFPYGLLSAGSVKDEVTATKAIKRVGVVDLGSLSWRYDETLLPGGCFVSYENVGALTPNLLCANYRSGTGDRSSISGLNKAIAHYNLTNNRQLVLTNSSYNASNLDVNGHASWLENNVLYYELRQNELIEIDIDPAKNMNYKVDDFGTEEFVSSETTVPQTAAPYQTTHYMDNLRDKLRNIDKNFVSATQEQNFTDVQKAQARENIGAGNVQDNGVYPNLTAGSARNLEGRGTVEADYTYRTSGGSADIGTGAATIDVLKGKTLKWQQRVNDSSLSASGSNNDINYTFDSATHIITLVSGTASATSFSDNALGFIYVNLINGHKYYVPSHDANTNIHVQIFSTQAGNVSKYEGIFTCEYTATDWLIRIRVKSGTTVDGEKFILQCFDLTEMGLDSITTPEEFEALYPLDYYAYTATPVLINNAASGIVTTGFNQWDEQWELGDINSTTGADINNNNTVRSIGFISVFPATEYYFKTSGMPLKMRYYDINKNYLGYSDYNGNANASDSIRKTPLGCFYIRFAVDNTRFIEEKSICINLSWSGYRNGEYEPYEQHTHYFDAANLESGSLATLTGKLLDASGSVSGSSVVIFPDGMKSAGSVYDFGKADADGYIRKVTKRIGKKDISTLTFTLGENAYWNAVISDCVNYNNNSGNIISDLYTTILSGIASTPNAIVLAASKTVRINNNSTTTAPNSGVIYYPLETPEEYLLDTPIPANYIVNDFGTEQRIPTDTSGSVQAPISYEVKYAMNATDTIRRLPINYIGAGSMENFTAELASTLGTFLSASIAVSSSYDATNQEYDYSISITPNA